MFGKQDYAVFHLYTFILALHQNNCPYFTIQLSPYLFNTSCFAALEESTGKR